MGRLSRHRKIKSCDPFYNGPKETDTSSNAPVSQSELDSQPVPRKVKFMLESAERIPEKGKCKSEKKARASTVKPSLVRWKGEMKKDYYQRLDKQAAEEVARIMMSQKHVSQKRKEFLKRRKEKNKKEQQVKDKPLKDFATDKVRFGETVTEPPSLTTKPRNAGSKKDKLKVKVDSLLLQSKLKTEKETKRMNDRYQSMVRTRKRKHMSALEQQVSDRRRKEAITAYRLLKKKPG